VGWQFPARRRAAARERLLAAAGQALLAAPDAAAVRRVAAEAAAGLLGLDAPAAGADPPAGELAGDPELVPDEARPALESLRAQVALALERADLAAEVARRASVDPLTGLANRPAFSKRLREALGSFQESDEPAPALLLLDDFKTINDSLGHSSGVEVLRVVAERLRGCLGPGDLAARLGGDEFAVLVPEVADEDEAVALGERLVPSCGPR
jgi:GGDEF domain-containing protein